MTNTHSCPLCGSHAALHTKQLSSTPIRSYWKALGYDLDRYHPEMPESFSVVSCVACGLGVFEPRMLGGPELYEALGRHEFYYEPARWDHRFAASFLQRNPPRRLLEFGCGEGKFLDVVRDIGGQTTGLDFNSAAIATARSKGHAAFTNWTEETAGPFDAIVTFQTLEHVPEPGRVVADLVERLAPGGHLIIAVPNEDGPLGELSANTLNLPPHHATLWPRSALDHIAAHHSLTVVAYATEPMNRALYVALIDEALGQLVGGAAIVRRLTLRLLRPLVLAFAAVKSAVPGALPHPGHNHLVVLQKPRG